MILISSLCLIAVDAPLIYRLPQTDESRAEIDRLCEMRHGEHSPDNFFHRKGLFWKGICLEDQLGVLDLRWIAKDSRHANVILSYFSKCLGENRWRIWKDVDTQTGIYEEIWVWDALATAKCLLDAAAAMAGDDDKESSLKPEPQDKQHGKGQVGDEEEDI